MQRARCGRRWNWCGMLLVMLMGALAGSTTAQAPTGAGGQRIGAQLIGKIEGPAVLTDPAMLPKHFQEAPMLATLVTQGKLPPVHARLPAEPLVIQPLHTIGTYGGTWRRGFTGPADKWNGYRCCAFDTLTYVNFTGDKLIPNVVKGWDIADGGRIFTLFLRQGMKWSDGAPFTADDFIFWYEDLFLNTDLNPVRHQILSINGKPGTLEKVNATTVRVTFPDPYYLFLDLLAAATPLGGHAYQGLLALGGYAPRHYLQQFHPKHAGQAAVDKIAQAEGYDNWVNLFKFKNDWALNPDLPVLTAWKTVSPINKSNWVLERNPYYWAVDTAGNQLPYIDRVSMTLAENLEVLNLRALGGEYDFQARHIDIQKLPVLLDSQARGGYKVYLDPMENGADYGIWFNLAYEADAELPGGSIPATFAVPWPWASIGSRSMKLSSSVSAWSALWPQRRVIRIARDRSTVCGGRHTIRPRLTRCSMPLGWTRKTPTVFACGPMARGGCDSNWPPWAASLSSIRRSPRWCANTGKNSVSTSS